MKIFITIFLLIYIFINTIPCQTFRDDSMAVIEIFKANKVPSERLDWNTILKFDITIRNGRISTLRLSDDYTTLDTIPPDIGKLTELTELKIYDSRIRYLPAEIGNLTKLQKLNLDDNKIQVLPPTIGNLTELRH